MAVRAHIPGLGTVQFPNEDARDKALVDLDRLWTENPLHRFHPHPKQSTFLLARDNVKAFLGGNRSGKTTAGIVDDLIQAVDEDCLPDDLKPFKRWEPPFDCRIVSPDFISTMEGVIFHKLREWAPRPQLHGGSWEKAYDKQRRLLRFKNGSVFSFMTFEQDLDKFGGWAGQRVHYDEEPPRNIRTECLRGLVDHGGDELFTMTPLQGMTWMYDEIYERRDADGVTVVQVATDENPHLNREALEAFFASLTEEEREARRKGRFVHFGGLVLRGFKDEHVIEEIDPDHLQGQDVYVGIDPGAARGGVVWCAFDRDNRMLVFDELYPSYQDIGPRTDPNTISAQIHAKNRYWGVKPIYVIDPSGRNRTATNAVGPEDEFVREGCIPICRGQNDRRTGVLQLRRRLAANPAALLVTRNCKSWLWERGRYRVAEDEESGQEKVRRNNADGDSFATQGPDHLIDPTRYVAMERFWGLPEPERRVRQRGMDESWHPRYKPFKPDLFGIQQQPYPPTGALT